MVELEKVIAGLKGCIACICSNCEYGGEMCTERLLTDALDVIVRLREENRDLRREVAAGVLRGMPNNWGEYPPEFPGEGM